MSVGAPVTYSPRKTMRLRPLRLREFRYLPEGETLEEYWDCTFKALTGRMVPGRIKSLTMAGMQRC